MKATAYFLGMLVFTAGCAQAPPADTQRIAPPPAKWMAAPKPLPDIPACSKSPSPIQCRAEYDARSREQYADVADKHTALQNWIRALLKQR